ncbi:hypothetical protein [Leifsonia sp. TF02-11]|uniref:hypothetical protein n=1 Tax=Leifsonia sp. TF02-11 TaxID=2815212 RepID=UPI001AA10BD8|nr:hypothetical protein [Leifsonia sp. TF02-11]MBO1741465.1 hypothetical protein [Leifsonia sp. TF02-11]
MDDPDFFLPAAAASRAGVPELEIHAAIDRGELRTVVYRGEIRIPAESLRAFRRADDVSVATSPGAGK